MNQATSTNIIQNHSGSGDNVGSKYLNVFQSLTPQHLVRQVEMIFSSVREKDNAKAAIQLEMLQNSENLDTSARSILQILSVHLGLADSAGAINPYPLLLDYLSTAQAPIEIDICLAALLRLDLKNGRIQDAIDRYEGAQSKGEYTKEVFYELIADTQTLENEFLENRVLLREGSLNGIIRGAVRTENFKLMEIATKRLGETYPSYNSQVFSLISDAYTLNPLIGNTQSLYIKKSIRTKIDSILEKTEQLITQSRGLDSRLFDIAVSLLQYIGWPNPKLQNTCWEFVSELEKNHPNYASRLHIIYKKDFTRAPEHIKKIESAKSSLHSRKEITNRILNSKTLDTNEIPLLFETLRPSEISQWLDSGGEFSILENDERDFVELLVHSVSITDTKDLLAIENLRSKARLFLDIHKNSIKHVNQYLLNELCENLYRLKQSTTACELLKPLLPDDDLWLSPPLITYLKSLLASHQTKTLNDILSKLDIAEWDATTWQLKAIAQEQSGDISGALSSAQQMFNCAPDDLNVAFYFAHLSKRNGADESSISQILKNISDNSLSKYSSEALRALVLIANFQSFSRAEKILLNWFSDDPNLSATGITNFHFNLIHHDTIRPSAYVDNFLGGYKYSKEGEEITRLIVKNKSGHNNYTIDAQSPIARLLENMKIGESATHSMQDLVLLERLDPYTTIFRLSLEIRNKNNDGSDIFSLMHAPDDPAQLVSTLERKMQESKSQQESRNSLLFDSELPLLLKGRLLNSGNPIKAAMEQFTNPESIKGGISNLGLYNPDKALLDPYTACYIALTGLAYGIPEHHTKFLITPETYGSIKEWLSEVTNPQYMTIGTNENGKLIKTTVDDINNQYEHLLNGLNIILENTEIIYPQNSDLPSELSQLENLFDFSTFSTIRTAIANDISWLCVDDKIAILHNSMNCKLMQADTAFIELGSKSNFAQKSRGLLLFSQGALPYALTYKDLYILASEKNAIADYALNSILKRLKVVLSSNDLSIDTVHRIFEILSIKGYLQKNVDQGTLSFDPLQSRFFESAFNLCLEVLSASYPSKTVELKLANAFSKLIEHTAGLNEFHRFVAWHMSIYANGHFLNVEAINAHLTQITHRNPLER